MKLNNHDLNSFIPVNNYDVFRTNCLEVISALLSLVWVLNQSARKTVFIVLA